MKISMSAGTPDVVKTNWVWSPIYNTLEMFYSIRLWLILLLLLHCYYFARHVLPKTESLFQFYFHKQKIDLG